MTVGMLRNRVLLGVAALVLILLGIAWADGGHEPLREVVEPVVLPEAAQ